MNNGPRYRVLLVGIDAYPVRPLYGCVNDIDAVQRLLVERAGIPVRNITRLASPHPGGKHETTVADEPATLANIDAALTLLASGDVGPTDRVFIYYSGHGGRTPVNGPQGKFYCESLVPVDFRDDPQQPRLLLDFEFNRLLSAIAKRTASVTVLLDCCHSTGATREVVGRLEMRARFLDFPADFGTGTLLQIKREFAPVPDQNRGAGSVDDCQIVAACLNHELAREGRGDDGLMHGLLTRAFVTELSQTGAGEIRSVTWARVWQKMRDSVETANPAQHLWMSGSYARAVLAGPPVEVDTGFAVKKVGPNEYAIDAGTVADVGEGARLAVYKDMPALFPPLGSPEDEAARVNQSLLKVVQAGRANALAQCEGAPFEPPPGARVRLVDFGPAGRLRCAVVPDVPAVSAALRASNLLQVVGELEAKVRLERRDGSWVLTDDVSGAKKDYPPLVTLSADQLDLAPRVLELYARYALPLRMAMRCSDLPGQLQVKLFACPDGGLRPDEAQKADLPEIPRHKALDYALEMGTCFCVHVRNASVEQLRVTLVNCAASGRVELLGDQAINPRSYYRFWLGNSQGVPFVASEAAGKRRYIDRMVAIGTTRLDKDLRYLSSDTRFVDVLSRKRTRDITRDLIDANESRPLEKWTTTQILLGVGITDGFDPHSLETETCTMTSNPTFEFLARKQPEGHDAFHANGIFADTGLPLCELDIKTASQMATGQKIERSESLVAAEKYRDATEDHRGILEGDPNDLGDVGWGIVFSQEASWEIKCALEPLIRHRQKEAGDLFRVFENADGYRPGESCRDWLERHGVTMQLVDPDKGIPFHLLLVGSPEEIPFEFQYMLDIYWGVGRLYFEDEKGRHAIAEYRRYADSVVTYETAEELRQTRGVTVFATRHEFDKATQMLSDLLARPLTERRGRKKPLGEKEGFRLQSFLEDNATKETLIRVLQGKMEAGPPALLFTGTHGMGFRPDDPRLFESQGALVCQDWQGWGKIGPGEWFDASDLPADAQIHGLIHFFFACYGAGCPQVDNFVKRPYEAPGRIAPRPFVARLPQKMLSHPNGGALAVLGHVDRAWSHSFNSSKAGSQLQGFQSVMGRLLRGDRVGHATDQFDVQRAVLAYELAEIQDNHQAGMQISDREILRLWIARMDARNYTVLGDPAVRLRVALENRKS